MANLTSQLVLRLVDRLSGPAGRIGATFRKTSADARQLGREFRAQDGSIVRLRGSMMGAAGSTVRMSSVQRRLRLDIEAATRAFWAQHNAARAASHSAVHARGGARAGAGAMVVGAGALGMRGLALAGGAYGVGRIAATSINSFAELDRRMRRVGLTADATSTQVSAATASVKELAMSSAVPLGDVVAGLEALVAQGRELPESMAFLPSVVRTAQAAGAEVEEIAKSADAVATHMKIAAEDMQGAFDILVAGGKAGQFELKDMARYLPSLAPAAKAVGLEGKKGLEDLVAMLQIIRKGSGTSEEAAASMNNILQKMSSQETIKRFSKMGVNLEAAFKKGRREGKNLLEVFEESAWKAIKGDLSQLPKLISDMEFARGVRALLSMRGEWQKMADTIRRTAPGSTLKDFNEVAHDSRARIERLTQGWENFKHSLGATIAPTVIPALEAVQKKLDELRKESDRSSSSERRTTGRDAFMAEAGRINPLIDENGEYIGPKSSDGGGSEFLRRLFNPETYGAGKAGQRQSDIAAARWRGVQAGVVARINAENEALAAPARIEEMIRRQEGLAESSSARAGSSSGLAAVTAREQVDKSRAEIARLRVDLENAKARAAEVARIRAAAPGEISALRRKLLSGAFDINGPAGSASGAVRAGLLGFGFGPRGQGAAFPYTGPATPTSSMPANPPLPPVRPKIDTQELEGAINVIKQIGDAFYKLSAPVKPNVDSSGLVELMQLIRQLDAGLSRLGQRASAIGREAAAGLQPGGQVRQAMRGLHADYTG